MTRTLHNYWTLVIFCMALILFTALFFHYRSYFHEQQQYVLIWVSAAVFAVVVFVTGILFGLYRRKHDTGVRFGFLFHFAWYVIFNSMWMIWARTGLSTIRDSLWIILLVMLIWGMGLLMHFFIMLNNRCNMIRGMLKDEIFE